MADKIIIVSKLVKTYVMGEVKVNALRGVDFEMSHGDFVAIMGTSGSGKTTFMNVLGCLDKPTSGQYMLDGIDVAKQNKDQLAKLRNTKIGFVFQSFNLLARTSAQDNVELPMLYNNKFNARQRKEKALAALKAVGLADRADHYPNQLSGGQQQRVALARALVNDPVIIMADEPTGNLDTRTSIEMMGIFQDLNAKGISILVVTHEPDIAQYCMRNIIFRDGLINNEVVVQDRKNAKDELAKLEPIKDIENELA